MTNATAIAAGYFHSLAIHRGGSVLAWGQNTAGQTNVPSGLDDAAAIGVGTNFSVAARAKGSVYVWGDTSILGLTPGLTDAIAVVCGEAHALALTQRGGLAQWGYDGVWGHEMAVPPRLRNVTAISAGRHQHLALVGEGPPVPPTLWPKPVSSTDACTIILPSRSGKVYALEFLDSLVAPAWTALPLAAGHGDLLTLTDSNGPHRSARFCRVGQW